MLLESLLTKVAAAGLATKAVAGGAAVVVAASAAGATDALPTPAQDTFDRLVVEEVELEEVEPVGDQEHGPEEGTFGERVSADANGDDGEPGVDGRQIACEASEGRSGTCEGEATEDEVSEDGPEEGTFGDRVSGDATGESDGEPGVDGRTIADEARAMNPGSGGEGADNAPEAARDGDTDEDDTDDTDDTDDGDDGDDDGGPEGTPGEAAANANRPSDQG